MRLMCGDLSTPHEGLPLRRCFMWCKNCQQDVAAVATALDGRPCCVRCGDVMVGSRFHAPSENRGVPEPAPAAAQSQTVTLRAPLSLFDHWELDEQLRHVERVLSGARFTAKVEAPADEAGARIESHRSPTTELADDTETDEAALDPTDAKRSSRRRFVHPRHKQAQRPKLTWFTVAAGAMALVGGIAMLACGWLLHRGDLQSIGLPITLLGQVAVLVGMVLQLDLVRRDHRRTDDKLSKFQDQLDDLEGLAGDLQGLAQHRHGVPLPAAQQRTLAELKQRLEVLSHRLNSPSA